MAKQLVTIALLLALATVPGWDFAYAGTCAQQTPKTGGLKGFMQELVQAGMDYLRNAQCEAQSQTSNGAGSTTTPSATETPSSLAFMAVAGSTNPAAQVVSIGNSGGGTLSWSASKSASWVALNPSSGLVVAGQTGSLMVTINTAGLSAGSYSSAITISAPGSQTPSVQVPITLTLSPPALIGVSPSSLSFVAVEGSGQSASQTVNISNTGSGTLSWSASDSASWLSLSPSSGSTTTQPSIMTVTVNPTGLHSTLYSAPITITAPGSNAQQVTVTLAVSAAGTGIAMLTWDPPNDPSVQGYKVYVGTASRSYGTPMDVGNITTYGIINLQASTTYYFAVTAYNSAGESDYSNEASKSIP